MYAALRVIVPPASEPISTDLARQHCRIDADYDDTLVAMYVTSARMWAEAFLNRALFTQQLQYNVTWAPPPTATPLVPQSLIVFPLNWPPLVKRPIELPRALPIGRGDPVGTARRHAARRPGRLPAQPRRRARLCRRQAAASATNPAAVDD